MQRLNTIQAANHLKALGVSYSSGTLKNWRSQGRGPRFHRVNGRIFYLKQDLEEFIVSEIVETSDSIKRGSAT